MFNPANIVAGVGVVTFFNGGSTGVWFALPGTRRTVVGTLFVALGASAGRPSLNKAALEDASPFVTGSRRSIMG